MIQTKIIMIHGKMGSGKTTLARNISERFAAQGIAAAHLKFAGPLYAMHDAVGSVSREFGIPFDEKEGRLLQLLGTEWGRAVKGHEVWVNALKYQIEKISLNPNTICIIDDCRFKNELYAFPEAFKVKLQAPHDVRKSRAHAWREDFNHPSEIDLDDVSDQAFDVVIDTSFHAKDLTAGVVYQGAMQKWYSNAN